MLYIGVMRPIAIDALRRSALLASNLPGVRIRLSHGQQMLAEIGGTDGRQVRDGVLQLGTTPFRNAVVDAWRHQLAGGRVAMLGLAEDVEPRIEIGVNACGTVRPGNVVVVRQAGAWVYAFATSLDVQRATEALQPLALSAQPRHPSLAASNLVARIDLHHDDDLDVSLVWTEAPPDPCPTRDAAVMSVVHNALAACAVAELDHELPSVTAL